MFAHIKTGLSGKLSQANVVEIIPEFSFYNAVIFSMEWARPKMFKMCSYLAQTLIEGIKCSLFFFFNNPCNLTQSFMFDKPVLAELHGPRSSLALQATTCPAGLCKVN